MEDLRTRWELPAISHFVATFHKLFDLPELHVEELENALLTSCTAEGSDLLNQLLANLLSGIYSSTNIEFYNYEAPLRDYLHENWAAAGNSKRVNPMTNAEFRNISLHDKIDILYSLCMNRLNAEDVADAVKPMSGEDMRVEPVGHDSEGACYWNFNDERLYKEDPPEEPPEKHKKKKKHKEKHKKRKHKHRDSVDSADEMEEAEPHGKWSLLCCAEEDWHKFVKQLKKSAHKQDKKLKKILANDFLPLIPDIIEEKEKAMKRRLLEMLPKRESNRLAKRRAEQDEQKAIMAKLDAEEKEEIKQKELEKKRLAEQKRREELAREREERILAREEEKRAQTKAREDRAMRALLREHKVASGTFNSTDDGSMSNESSEVTDWEDYNETAGGTHLTLSHRQRSNRNRQRNSINRPTQFGPREYEKINRILYQLQRNPNCWPFLEPVTREIAPDYFDIIERPMDISVIRRKANRKEYFNKQQFADDLNLIVENCTKYNGANSEYGRMAASLKDKFDSLIEKSFSVNVTQPQRPRQSADAVNRVSYTEQMSDSADSVTDDSDNNDSDSSQSSLEQPKKKINNRNAQRHVKPLNNRKNPQSTARRPNNNKLGTTTTEDSTESESNESDAGSNLYNFMMSNNPPMSTKSLSMSQSHQILTDGPIVNNMSPNSRPLFGIARRTSTANHSQSGQTTTPTHQPERMTVTSTASSKPVSLLSPPAVPSGAKMDKTTELARWMGKSPQGTCNISNGTSNASSPVKPASDNVLKIQPISRPQEPFQGLFTQLKRNSVDTAPTGPLYKRVA